MWSTRHLLTFWTLPRGAVRAHAWSSLLPSCDPSVLRGHGTFRCSLPGRWRWVTCLRVCTPAHDCGGKQKCKWSFWGAERKLIWDHAKILTFFPTVSLGRFHKLEGQRRVRGWASAHWTPQFLQLAYKHSTDSYKTSPKTRLLKLDNGVTSFELICIHLKSQKSTYSTWAHSSASLQTQTALLWQRLSHPNPRPTGPSLQGA